MNHRNRFYALAIVLILSGCTQEPEEPSDPVPDLISEKWIPLSKCVPQDCSNTFLVRLDSIKKYNNDIITYTYWKDYKKSTQAINCKTSKIYVYTPGESKNSGLLASRFQEGYTYRTESSYPISQLLCRFTPYRSMHGMNVKNINLWNAPPPDKQIHLLNGKWLRVNNQVEDKGWSPYIEYYNTNIESDGRTIMFSSYFKFSPRKNIYSLLKDWFVIQNEYSDPDYRLKLGYYSTNRIDCNSGARSIFVEYGNDHESLHPASPKGYWFLKDQIKRFPGDLENQLLTKYCSRPNSTIPVHNRMPIIPGS